MKNSVWLLGLEKGKLIIKKYSSTTQENLPDKRFSGPKNSFRIFRELKKLERKEEIKKTKMKMPKKNMKKENEKRA